MSTSGTDLPQQQILHHAAVSLCFAAFCAFFGAVYEHFSFGVYSYYMIYAFAAPLLNGILLVLAASGQRKLTYRTVLLMHGASLTFTVGSITAGIIRIYGTDHPLLRVYPAAAGILAVLALWDFARHCRTP